MGQALAKEQMTMHNKDLKIGAVHYPPSSVITKDENGKYVVGGLTGKLFEYVKNTRNCTFEIVIPADRQFGICHGENNCTGMIGLVNRREVDLAIGDIFLFISLTKILQ